jgi:ATP-dependent Clp protease ATP-binding subunit ClpA
LIQEKIKKPLAEDLLFGRLANGGHVRIEVENDALVFAIESKQMTATELNQVV